jgi:glyoxalase/bleomycin resistance protein/dioxygenase superfamily protein
MALDLFAGLPVTEYAAALPWYEKLLGAPPSFRPTDTEAVWELAQHRFVYIVELPQRAGCAVTTVFVDDLDERVAGISERGIEPAQRETYGNDVRKVTYRDADGNEVGFGGGPV